MIFPVRPMLKIGVLALTCIIIGYSLSNLYSTEYHLSAKPIPYPAGIRWSTWSPPEVEPVENTTNSTQPVIDIVEHPKPKILRPPPGLYASESVSIPKATKTAVLAWADEEDDSGLGSLDPAKPVVSKKPSIGKATILEGVDNQTYEDALETHVSHNRIHKYPLSVMRTGSAEPAWTKPTYMLSLLLRELTKPSSERLEWLLYVFRICRAPRSDPCPVGLMQRPSS